MVTSNVICRHDLPHSLVTGNDRQFTDKNIEQFLTQLGVKHLASSMEHFQRNRQAEATNKVILGELRKKLGQMKGLWAEEIPSIL